MLVGAGSGADVPDPLAIVAGVIALVFVILDIPELRRAWQRKWVGPIEVKTGSGSSRPGGDLVNSIGWGLVGVGLFVAGVLPNELEESHLFTWGIPVLTGFFFIFVLSHIAGHWGWPKLLVPPPYRAEPPSGQVDDARSSDSEDRGDGE